MAIQNLNEFLDFFRKQANRFGKKASWNTFRIVAEEGGLQFYHGATRGVFTHDKWDFVIKIDRMWDADDHKYCELEAENYASAIRYGIQQVVLPTELVAEINSIKIYRQPKYTFSANELPRQFKTRLHKKLKGLERKDIVNKIDHSCYDGIYHLWLAHALLLYGKAYMKSFEAWTQEHRINDLHTGNIGWLKGKPILLDYAGYFG